MQDALRTLSKRGWEQRLTPLAEHMAQRHLVRGRNYAGAFQRRLDLEVLREVLSRLLREEWEDGHLIFKLVVEGTEPATVAAERGTSQAALVEQLRDAVDALAVEYEGVANESLDEGDLERVRSALARKRR